jgi:tRNA(adenine34) deaminase
MSGQGGINMWKTISEPWKVCFEEAWESYRNGSIPIGAVIVSNEGEIISRGRNMVGEDIKELNRLSRSNISHAEMNAIYSSEQGLKNTIIYSSMEPCIMCFGAIVMSGIKEINYAARDGVAGGINLKNAYIKKRDIKINEHNPELEIVQLIIKADFIYRNFGERAEELLSVWEETCPLGIQIGRQWYKEDRLINYKEAKYTIEQVIEKISQELNSIRLSLA